MININPKYKNFRLYFDEPTHKYTDNFANPYVSTTTFLHNYEPAFNSNYWAEQKAKEGNTSKKVILDNWADITKNACDMGNKYHNHFEDGIRQNSKFFKAVQYLNRNGCGVMTTVADLGDINHLVKPLDVAEFREFTKNKYPEIYSVFDFYTERGYKIYSEIGAFLPDYLLSGTIDILFIRDDKFIIGDWKTNRKGIEFSSGYYKKDKTIRPAQETNLWVDKDERLLPPLGNLQKCNGSIYSLQLNMYAMMAHLITGLPCAGLILCHIGVPFILNQYGRPQRFDDGYHIDTTKEEVAKWYKINFLYNEIQLLLADRQRAIEGQLNTQGVLFNTMN